MLKLKNKKFFILAITFTLSFGVTAFIKYLIQGDNYKPKSDLEINEKKQFYHKVENTTQHLLKQYLKENIKEFQIKSIADEECDYCFSITLLMVIKNGKIIQQKNSPFYEQLRDFFKHLYLKQKSFDLTRLRLKIYQDSITRRNKLATIKLYHTFVKKIPWGNINGEKLLLYLKRNKKIILEK